jgi:acyl carrier protein
MMFKDIEVRLGKLLCEKVPTLNSLEEIKLDADLKEYGLNSLAFVQLVTYIEEEFSIEFDFEALNPDYLKTFKDLISYIEKKIS